MTQHVHFIGIGGYGMSGLALLLRRRGWEVSGSDVRRSSRTERLERHGVTVYYGHRPEQVAGAELVVYNTDVPEDNPERTAARDRGLPLLHRSELLARVLEGHRALTVSGTHGKTTTTTMLAVVLEAAGYDPTVLVGGEVDRFDGNMRAGASAWAVAEADESDGSFLRYHPWVAVATNVEPEHLEHYGGDFGQVVAAFRTYLTRVPPDGLAVLGGDNPVLRSMADGLTVPRALYGLDPAFDVWADDLAPDAGGTRFRVHAFGAPPLTARLPVPGVHNVVDALGAVTAAAHAGVAPAAALEALAGFRNARRRLEVHYRGIVTIIDDYAHHPTEIRATIAACRQLTTGTGRLLVAFQPQRYRRTRNLWEGFAAAFPEADAVYLTEIYAPPGETPLPGVEGRRLAQAVAAASGVPVRFLPDPAAVAEAALAELRPGDTFLTMGAGDIYRAAERLAAAYRAAPAGRAGSG